LAPEEPNIKFRLAFGIWHGERYPVSHEAFSCSGATRVCDKLGENRAEAALDLLAELVKQAHPAPLPEAHQAASSILNSLGSQRRTVDASKRGENHIRSV